MPDTAPACGCLSRPQRVAYLLADVLGLTASDGAEILGCTREAFRQLVSGARRSMRQVIDKRCGLIDPANPCRCGRQIASTSPPLRSWGRTTCSPGSPAC